MIEILRNGFTNETPIIILAYLLAILLSISFHEYAHAYVAYKQGDDTAKLLGRLTINPLAHFDILGFLSFILVGFGWAKPVPINPIKFKEYRRGIFLTSIAGIVANFFLAFFGSGVYTLILKISPSGSFGNFIITFLVYFFEYIIVINLSLALFNLIPIAPLDGFNLLRSLKKSDDGFIRFLSQYGYIILFILVLTPILDYAINYVVKLIYVPFIGYWNYVW